MSLENKWKYYNHAIIPPDEIPDMQPIVDGTIWKIGDGGGINAVKKMKV